MNEGLTIQDSLTMTTEYRPALFFAKTACQWYSKIADKPSETLTVHEAQLVLMYSSMSLEALIAQKLHHFSECMQVDDLFSSSVSVMQRWRSGAGRLAANTEDAKEALAEIEKNCRDNGFYGLLVRSRNKLVHPRVHTEIFDDDGHHIEDGSVSNLVQQLSTVGGLPMKRPAYPHILNCVGMADYAKHTLSLMTNLLFRTIDQPVPTEWQEFVADSQRTYP